MKLLITVNLHLHGKKQSVDKDVVDRHVRTLLTTDIPVKNGITKDGVKYTDYGFITVDKTEVI